MRKRIKAGILALLLAGILMLGGCIPNYKVGGKALIALSKETREVKETLVKNLFTMLNGDSASFLDTLSTNSKVSFENEWEFWQEQVRTYGAYEGYIYKEGWAYGEDIIFCVTASLNGHEIEAETLSYFDFVADEKAAEDTPSYKEAKDFFNERLGKVEGVTEVPSNLTSPIE